MPEVVCVSRGTDEIDSGIQRLDESKVQLLFTKFPVGSGTFKRNKFLYVIYIGPKCGVVKRGQGINEMNTFVEANLHGVPGFSTTDKLSLSFDSLVHHMKDVFVTDDGTFSLEDIREQYKSRLLEEQKKMHQDAVESARAKKKAERLHHAKALSRSVMLKKEGGAGKEEEEGSGKSPSPARQLTVQERSELTQRVMAALRKDNGPINWAVFAPDPANLQVVSYGRNGIFELVKNLPEDQWLFGLFRISFFTGDDRQRRMIFFQWIGSKLRAVRNGGTTGIYPGMAKALAPFAYEIYLVGQNDLQPQAIINKSKNAFNTPKRRTTAQSEEESLKEMLLKHPVFTEDSYRESLLDEQTETKDIQLDVFLHPDLHTRKTITAMANSMTMEVSMPSVITSISVTEERFDIEETLALVQCEEGGLVWSIFEVHF